MNPLLVLLSTGCYAGYSPKAPGTLGSALGVLLAWALSFAPSPVYLIAMGLGIPLAIWVSDRAEKHFGHDAKQIVIDEVIGMIITLAWVPSGLTPIVLGFIFFRLMDITKIFPANYAQHLPGGLGIVADDVVAAIYANFLVRISLFFLLP